MKIEILRDMTKGVAEQVWRDSRHQDSDVSGVHKIDAPVMDFPTLTLAIECTIAEREVFVSFREHVMWARTSRVDDPLLFEVTPLVESRHYEQRRRKMQQDKDSGVSQDDYRMALPLVAMTSFTLQVSVRTLIKMFWTFKQLSETTNHAFFADAALKISQTLGKVDHSPMDMPNAYVDVLPDVGEFESGRVGDMITIYIPDATIALRAQAIRHRSLQIKDSMRSRLYNADVLTIGDRIILSISADVEVWKGIAKKRQCWLAQHDLWKPVLDEVGKIIDLSKELPCSSGSCPYEADAVLRYTDKDPNPPCPMHACITKTRFVEHTVDALQMVKRDSRPNWWNTVIKNAGEVK